MGLVKSVLVVYKNGKKSMYNKSSFVNFVLKTKRWDSVLYVMFKGKGNAWKGYNKRAFEVASKYYLKNKWR